MKVDYVGHDNGVAWCDHEVLVIALDLYETYCSGPSLKEDATNTWWEVIWTIFTAFPDAWTTLFWML